MYLLIITSNEDAARCRIYIAEKVDAASCRVPYVQIWEQSPPLDNAVILVASVTFTDIVWQPHADKQEGESAHVEDIYGNGILVNGTIAGTWICGGWNNGRSHTDERIFVGAFSV